MRPNTRRVLRSLALPAALLVGGALLAWTTGFDEEQLRALLAAMGWWAAPAFILLFVIGILLNLPGTVFFVTAPVLFGVKLGFVLAYLGSMSAVTVGFMFARLIMPRVDGTPFKNPVLRRAFAQLETRPIRTVALIRLMMWSASTVHYALAVTPIRKRDHFIGSAIGLIIPVAVIVGLSGVIF